MQTIKHYSFDLWLTLIRSHPEFKKERSRFFYTHFNPGKLTIEDIDAIFRKVDVMCNLINEKTGKNIDSDEMYLMVLSMMDPDLSHWHDLEIETLYAEMEQLVFRFMPVLFCPETAVVLKHLKEQGATINILSNTGFIKGATLRPVLEHLDIGRYFDFQIYSDETGMSKPNRQLFALMHQTAGEYYPAEELTGHQILHIGDNPKADIEGAGNSGIQSMLINSNNVSITKLIQPCP